MIAKFFLSQNRSYGSDLKSPCPQTRVSLLKSSSLSWRECGTNWEGRLIQERCQWEPGKERFGVGRVQSPPEAVPILPSKSSRAGGEAGTPQAWPSLCPLCQTQGTEPRGGCARARGAFGGSEMSPQEREHHAHLLRHLQALGLPFQRKNIWYFHSYLPFCQLLTKEGWTSRSLSNLVFSDELFLYYLHHFSAWY